MKRFLLLLPLLMILIGFPLSQKQAPLLVDKQAIPQSVYVWQREWTARVQGAVTQQGPQFNRLCYLGAEITWTKDHFHIFRVEPDFESLKSLNAPVSIALRIGVWHGPFAEDDWRINLLSFEAHQLINKASSHGLTIHELQLDFDCPESQLKGYRTWIRVLQKRLAPINITFTALPSWLDHHAFPALARQAPNYVLQVHSLKLPRSIQHQVTLFNLSDTYQWMRQANRLGVAYRVALPTYAYLLAFDHERRFIRPYAENLPDQIPADWTIKRLEPDQKQLAFLIKQTQALRPRHFKGFIWYRLPVAGDQNNWDWITLQQIMKGQIPHSSRSFELTTHAQDHSIPPGLHQVTLINSGQTHIQLPQSFELKVNSQWPPLIEIHLPYMIADRKINGSEHSFTVRIRKELLHLRLAPQQKISLGWLRGDDDMEVELNAESDSGNPSP